MKQLYSIIVLIGFILGSFINKSYAQHHSDSPSVHGMLLFGSEHIYLSHLPMFHSPHDYQVIVEVHLSEDAKKIYLGTKVNNPSESVYTLVPEVFVLPDMIANSKPFKAKIFQGHFERGGTQIAEAKVDISKIIYFSRFDPNQSHPKNLKYIYFGYETELFAAHQISVKPDFDQVLEVSASPMLIKLLNTQAFIEVELPGLQLQTPIKPGSTPKSYAITGNGPVDLDLYKIGQELYLEFGDLSF